ncbi:hypothetical protein ASF69_09075 [Rhizobium sp. Leaf311]|uniref:hypothetical protein n=1 Tax=Rhizobium sp. Leaf311 TaxID=1736332 RepID=UPI00071234EF|nr:hypothetical protein [Rhizobium sp. Leaf311]KQQ44743.1 hypothetical protein ASF69_09075 [Rhizobium sp. Leaf311]
MIRDNGHDLRASFDIEGEDENFVITFHSRGGTGDEARNPDYIPGLKVLLHRLASVDVTMRQVHLDSGPARKAVNAGLMFRHQLLLPETSELDLARLDTDELCKHISREQKSIKVVTGEEVAKTDSPGNGTRRIRLEISVPGFRSAESLNAFLTFGDDVDVQRLQMTIVESGWQEWFMLWHSMLRTGEDIGKDRYYFPSADIRVQIVESEDGSIPKTRFGIGRSGRDWIVEINPPKDASTEDRLGTVAIDQDGRRWLLRQGVLHKNRLSGRIDKEFCQLTSLRPVEVKAAKRSWYPVELLDRSSVDLPVGTLEFVKRCAIARSPGDEMQVSGSIIYGAPEIAGSYLQKAAYRAEREVLRKQGYVWEALKEIADQNKADLTKPSHAAGYEVDGLLKTDDLRFLLEIKTTAFASDIYTGVGQLHLYDHMINGVKGAIKVLLLPRAPQYQITEAVLAANITVLLYDFSYRKDALVVTFPAATRAFFGFRLP